MQHTTFTLNYRYLAWLYALWLNGLTYAFYRAEVPFSGEDWFDPLEEAVRFPVRAFIETLVD